jgi:beta-xylosidase
VSTLPEVLSWWAFTDIFEEPGFAVANSSFHGGFGLLNVYQARVKCAAGSSRV